MSKEASGLEEDVLTMHTGLYCEASCGENH